MAFVRTKKIRGKQYRYLVESYRDKQGKIRQRTLKYLGAVEPTSNGDSTMAVAKISLTFEEYLKYDDGSNKRYELVDGELVEMPPASFLHSDIIDFIADCFKAIARKYKLDIKVKTGDVGVRTGMNSSRIPDLSVIEGSVWRSMPRDVSAVILVPLMLAVEVVSPSAEQIERDYQDKVAEYAACGIPEYWIVDPIEQKVTVNLLAPNFWRGDLAKTTGAEKERYIEKIYTVDEEIRSNTFPELKLTANAILSA